MSKKKSDIIMLVVICAIVFGGLALIKHKRLDEDRAPLIKFQ